MSSQVIVTTMEPVDPPKPLRIKIDLHKTPPGLIKLLQAAVGATCIGLCAQQVPVFEVFFLKEFATLSLISFPSLMTTFLLLVSYMVSYSDSVLLQKTLFELSFHFVSSLLYLGGSISLLVHVTTYSDVTDDDDPSFLSAYKATKSIGVLGLVNSGLYFLSAYCNFHNLRSE